jgi:hypothetical protein
MVNSMTMTDHFEREKNIKASVATLIVCTCIFLLFFFVQWTSPIVEKPIITEGIEVNIGNSDMGSGTEQPMEPGEPGAESNPDNTTAAQTATATASPDNTPTSNDPDAAPISTLSKPNISTTTNTTTAKKTTAIAIPTTPKPKMVMSKYGGGNGTGGNNADTYHKSTGEGNDPFGDGDKGKSNGTFTGKTYDGPGGISIRNGLTGRKPTKLPIFEDDFNENAKVAVDITINKAGKVTSAVVNPKGTSTANQNTRKIALKRAMDISFSAGAEDQSGTIILDMRVRG